MKLTLIFSLGTSQCSQRFWNHSIEGFEDVSRPLIIAHRGASGDRPAHSIEAYQLAIEHGTFQYKLKFLLKSVPRRS